jgi:transglutaminase-like putative cysteine protease
MEKNRYNPEILRYLQSGEQTIITPIIKEIASSFIGDFDEKVQAMFRYIKTLDRDETNKQEIFRKRTASQIAENGFITGCTDEGLVFITLARAAGIPAKYIETIKNEGLTDIKNNNGHVFVAVYSKEKGWEIIDPEKERIGVDPTKKGFTIVGEGLDSWDLGITDFFSLKEKFNVFRNSLK